MKDKLKEPPFEIRNGKKVYRMQFRVDSQLRGMPPAGQGQAGKPAPQTNNAATTDGGASGPGGQESTGDADAGALVRVPCRVLSAVDTWSWHDWYGPCFVRNGHDEAKALRQVIGFINEAPRPIPLMWNHSEDMHDKAGFVENAAWEESKDIPPGVNADLVVDRRYDEKAANGLELGVIDATSVAWWPHSERSHPDMDFWTFMELQGKEVDGEIVAWLPLECQGVQHHAMVPAGADPNSGPRNEHCRTQNAAAAATNTKPEGGGGMEKELMALILAVCNGLGVNVALVAGQQIPDWLERSLTDKVTALNGAVNQYNEVAKTLQSLGGSLLNEGETSLTVAQVLERLPGRLALAGHGEEFLKYRKEEALAWFDKAHVDPANQQGLTDVQKRQRERIAHCNDLTELADTIIVNQEVAKKRFGPQTNLRTSEGDEVPQNTAEPSAEDRRIRAQMNRWKQPAQEVK